jgi:peptide deformylase
MSKILRLRRIGDPVLRKKCRKLTFAEIRSKKIRQLVEDMKYTCREKEYGVGISAPQVGEPVAASAIMIKPTPYRPNLKPFEKVLFNTEIVETFGEPEPMWEGCCSVGGPDKENLIYGQVPRYKKIRIKYLDVEGEEKTEIIDGFVAHCVQHETDHLGGILFTDKADPKSLMMGDEYERRVVKK